jgi:predicted outer membrane repeat protein
MYSSAFRNNKSYHGGAIHNRGEFNASGLVFGGSFTEVNSTQYGNLASRFGGAIYNEESGLIQIEAAFFNVNTGYEGGAIYSKGRAEITCSTFSQNRAL